MKQFQYLCLGWEPERPLVYCFYLAAFHQLIMLGSNSLCVQNTVHDILEEGLQTSHRELKVGF